MVQDYMELMTTKNHERIRAKRRSERGGASMRIHNRARIPSSCYFRDALCIKCFAFSAVDKCFIFKQREQ